MDTGYAAFADPRDLPRLIADRSACTVVIDIEPFVAVWDGTLQTLDRGIDQVVALVAAIPGVRAVCFATNSARRPSVLPQVPGIDVTYLVSARKPVRLAQYARLPRPGVVVGDQVLTDGLLARRLGYHFLHYRPPQPGPVGPRVLDLAGRLGRPLIFRR
jgi:predicted HAD superfamily phosphohydrolase YqeG